jgi:hypothetical protein
MDCTYSQCPYSSTCRHKDVVEFCAYYRSISTFSDNADIDDTTIGFPLGDDQQKFFSSKDFDDFMNKDKDK